MKNKILYYATKTASFIALLLILYLIFFKRMIFHASALAILYLAVVVENKLGDIEDVIKKGQE